MRVKSEKRRRLNAFDQCMLGINDVLQWLGNVGFETVSLIWLERRLDVGRLRVALDELARRHPVLTARVVRNRWGRHFWDWSSGAGIPVHESALADATEASVDDAATEASVDDAATEASVDAAAAAILSRRRNLRTDAPLAFHLLHLPGDGDVLIVHANHTLCDHGSAMRVLVELHELLRGNPLPPPAAPYDAIERYRRRFSVRQRLGALLRNVPDYVRDRWDTWRRARILADEPSYDPIAPRPVRIASRRLEGSELDELDRRVRRSTRLPSPSLCVLASAFRTFAGLVPGGGDDVFRTGIGVEVDRQRPDEFHPQNVSSVLRLTVTRRELEDADTVPDLLGRRLLREMRQRRDLGILESNSLFGWNYPLVRRIAGATIRWAFSLWYAYFAVPPEFADDFGGVRIRRFRYLGPAWSPPGVTLLATHFRDELHLSLTYVEGLVDDDRALDLLDGVVADLLAERRASGARRPAPATT